MFVNEEKKLGLEAGEFIHSIANGLITGDAHIEGVDAQRAHIIMEISEALRQSSVTDSIAPLLSKECYLLSQYPRSQWIDIASRLINAPKETSICEIVNQAKKWYQSETDNT